MTIKILQNHICYTIFFEKLSDIGGEMGLHHSIPKVDPLVTLWDDEGVVMRLCRLIVILKFVGMMLTGGKKLNSCNVFARWGRRYLLSEIEEGTNSKSGRKSGASCSVMTSGLSSDEILEEMASMTPGRKLPESARPIAALQRIGKVDASGRPVPFEDK